jgi:glycosyltransferase involved in cell wall biosynthesis
MPMRPIEADDAALFERGSPAVCIQAIGAADQESVAEQLLATVLALIEHTDPSTPVLIAAAAALADQLAGGLAARPAARTLLCLTLDPRATRTEAVNAAARAIFPSDLILLAAGTQVTPRWAEGLAGAATSDTTVASATPLSLVNGALGLFDSGAAEGVAGETDELARRISERGLKLRPRIATVGEGCAYVRRSALELVGPLDETLPLEAALDKFALAAVAAGMVHVAADDVLVAISSGPPSQATKRDEQAPDLGEVQETIVNDEHGRLHRAVAVGRIALRRLSVTIDGRALVAAVGGTQTYILDVILALARQPGIALRVLVAPDLSERAGDALGALPGIELLSYEQALKRPRMTDVVHRPQPVFTADDLALLRLVGERVVIGQQDLISYHNYSYHRDVESWRSFRRTTRLALAAADQVIFFSEHARRDALSEDLLPRERTHVIGVGAEALEPAGRQAMPPASLPADEPFLLCLGADYEHKNRPFAIELLSGLRDAGWGGRLVLAGPHVPFGSSREREQAQIGADPGLAELVVDLGPVEEPVKQWLFEHARAVVYPTVYEGLGLLPLEAARVGVPCLFAPQASLAENAGVAATLVPWDADASATAVLPLLTEGAARTAHLAELRSLSGPAWSEVAENLVAVYEQAVTAPPSEAAPRSWQELDRETYISELGKDLDHLRSVAQEYQDAYHQLEARVSSGLPLIDEGGLLSLAQQRGLMRIAGRRGLATVLLAPFGVLGRRQSTEPAQEGSDQD